MGGTALIAILAAVAIVSLAIFLLVHGHGSRFKYRCPYCGAEFKITRFRCCFSRQGLDRKKGTGWKILCCPKCQRRGRAKVFRREGAPKTNSKNNI